jgi:uncharacterized membrane protein (UPF0127 family)
MKKLLISIFCVFLLHSCSVEAKRATLSINGRPLDVEIARTRRQREKGLMFREELGWNDGMLFIFPEEQYLSFWMKDTSIPLSIAYIDEAGDVVDIFDMTPFSLDPVRSSRKCRFAIEVNQGFYEEAGLVPGDRIDMSVVRIR